MSSATKKVVLISGGIGLLLGVLLSSLLFPRIVTKNNTIFSEKKILDTVYIEKNRIVIKEVEKRIVITDTIRIGEDSIKIDTNLVSYDSISPDSEQLKQELASVVHDTVDSVVGVDIVTVDSVTESMGSYSYVQSNGSEIRVSKNELVYSTIIKPEGNPSNFYCNTNNDLDSLLMDNHVEKQKLDGIRVEFWASPLNTTGYRLNKHRLILFGFYEYEHVKLRYMDDGRLNLTYFNNSYQLGCKDDFYSLVIKR